MGRETVSLALATKGMISGIGLGTGGGGTFYPENYVASEVEVSVDTTEMLVDIDVSEVSVSIDVQNIELTIETYEED
jgi:hypothetical protein